MCKEDFPIEYCGVTPSNSPFNTAIEKIFYVPNDIKLEKIIKIYANIDKILVKKNLNLKGIDYSGVKYCSGIIVCICNILFNIEYIDSLNKDTISIFSDYIYAPLSFPMDYNLKLNSFSPKISNIYLRPLNSSSFYLYLSIYAC
jgi:hypothetical protein